MNSAQINPTSGRSTAFINAANQSITVNGIPFAYRDTGLAIGVPLVLFTIGVRCWTTSIPQSSMAWRKPGASSPPTIAASVAQVEPRR
jgi:hypothetical protein